MTKVRWMLPRRTTLSALEAEDEVMSTKKQTNKTKKTKNKRTKTELIRVVQRMRMRQILVPCKPLGVLLPFSVETGGNPKPLYRVNAVFMSYFLSWIATCKSPSHTPYLC